MSIAWALGRVGTPQQPLWPSPHQKVKLAMAGGDGTVGRPIPDPKYRNRLLLGVPAGCCDRRHSSSAGVERCGQRGGAQLAGAPPPPLPSRALAAVASGGGGGGGRRKQRSATVAVAIARRCADGLPA